MTGCVTSRLPDLKLVNSEMDEMKLQNLLFLIHFYLTALWISLGVFVLMDRLRLGLCHTSVRYLMIMSDTSFYVAAHIFIISMAALVL